MKGTTKLVMISSSWGSSSSVAASSVAASSWRAGTLLFFLLLLLLLSSSSTVATSSSNLEASQLLEKVIQAIGTASSLLALHTNILQLETFGTTYFPYEGSIPNDIVPTTDYKRIYTFNNVMATTTTNINNNNNNNNGGSFILRIDDTVTYLYDVLVTYPSQTYSRIIHTSSASSSSSALLNPTLFTSKGKLPSSLTQSIQKQQYLMNPHFLILMAMTNPIHIFTVDKKKTMITFLIQGDNDDITTSTIPSYTIDLILDENTMLPRYAVTLESHPLVGDQEIMIRYADWSIQTMDQLRFPKLVSIETSIGELLWWEERTSVVSTGITVPDDFFTLPHESIGDGGDNDDDEEDTKFGILSSIFVEGYFQFFGPYMINPPLGDDIITLAEGKLYMIPSETNSIVIQHSNGIILLEGPHSSEYGTMLANRVRTMFNNKSSESPTPTPMMIDEVRKGGGGTTTTTTSNDEDEMKVTHLIQSHHHVEHSAGCREIISLTGAELVIAEPAKSFWKYILNDVEFTIHPTVSGGGAPSSKDITIHDISVNEKEILIEEGISKTTSTDDEEDDEIDDDDPSDDLIVSVYSTTFNVHALDSLITVINTGTDLFIYEADILLGLSTQEFYNELRSLNIITMNCTSTTLPITLLPSHGNVKTLQEATQELLDDGIDVGCTF